jgi:hypothetical protein
VLQGPHPPAMQHYHHPPRGVGSGAALAGRCGGKCGEGVGQMPISRPAGEGIAMTARDADQLKDLARRIERLRPDHRRPEQFHVEKDEIAYELRRLARTAGRGETRQSGRRSS